MDTKPPSTFQDVFRFRCFEIHISLVFQFHTFLKTFQPPFMFYHKFLIQCNYILCSSQGNQCELHEKSVVCKISVICKIALMVLTSYLNNKPTEQPSIFSSNPVSFFLFSRFCIFFKSCGLTSIISCAALPGPRSPEEINCNHLPFYLTLNISDDHKILSRVWPLKKKERKKKKEKKKKNPAVLFIKRVE